MGDGAIVSNETVVVASQPQEGADCAHYGGQRSVDDCLHLVLVHGDACVGDHMAEVGDFCVIESTLGSLHEQLVFLQHGEDESEVL
jgi:hypothetical protein